MWAEFHFLRPWWLLTLLPLAFLLIAFARRRFEMRRWQNVVDAALMPHVLIGTGQGTRRYTTLLLALAGLLLVTALAGPVWQRMPQPVFRSLDAMVIVLDLSASMNAADIKPSRLTRARFKIRDILRLRADGQTALVAYAADAFVVSPLTDDAQTIGALVPALTTSLMPSQGSRADRGLLKARELLLQSGATSGHIVLVTDGIDVDRVAPVATDLAANGFQISVLGVGTSAGGPIPGENGFILQRDGSIVIAKLESAGLKQIARDGDGKYRLMVADDSDISTLLAGMSDQPGETEATGLETDSWREAGPWLLLPLLLLAPYAFRRGVLAAWLVVLVLPIQPAKALAVEDLWSRPDQRASQLLASGDAAAAAEEFSDPAWKAAAAYQASQYADSLVALEDLTDIESTYNRGNALAQLGRYDEAIAAYEEVLEGDAEHRDARYNLEQVKKQQQQDQSENQQSEQGQGEESQPDPDGEGQDSSASDGSDNSDSADSDSANGDERPQSSQGDDGANADAGENSAGQNQGGNADNESGVDSKNDFAGDAGADAEEDPSGQSDQQPAQNDSAMAGDVAEQNDPNALNDQEAAAENMPLDEEALATEQWLRKIPDDPGGLLRRKFYYQYQRQAAEPEEEQPW